jgi:sortase A
MAKVKRYVLNKGIKRRLGLRGLIFIGLALSLICGGLYVLSLVFAPNQKLLTDQQQSQFVPTEYGEQQIIIPKIAVNTPILEGGADVLDKGVWHRLPELGSPITGGNFIVTGHRYVLSATPGRTKDQSYFYNVDKLELGDKILVDWQHKRYVYKITKLYSVKPTQLEVESPSSDPKLTLYTCTLGGAADGRVVIEAYPEK